MASVRMIHNKKGISYKIEVSNGYDLNGKKIRYTTTFKPDSRMSKRQQEKSLQKFVYDFEYKVKHGRTILGEKTTLEQFIDEWKEVYAKNRLEKTSYGRYQEIINKVIIPALGHMKLAQIKPYHIEKLYITLSQDGARQDHKTGGYSRGSINTVKIVLSSILSSAEQWEMIDSNPCRKAKLPKNEEQHEKVKCFNADQARRFLKFVDHECGMTYTTGSSADNPVPCSSQILQMQYCVFFRIAIFGGLRRGEILALEWKNIDFDNCLIYVRQSVYYIQGEIIIKSPKTKDSIRSVSFPRPVIDLLKDYKQKQDLYRESMQEEWIGGDWLFIQTDGRLMNVSSPNNKFHRLVKKYNENASMQDQLPVLSLHDLRHTNASLLVYSNKIDTKTISKKLGHSDMSTTMKYYVHSYDEGERETAEILEDILLSDSVDAE